MKKLIFIVATLFLSCSDGTHHMTPNDENGFNTSWDAKTQSLKFSGWDAPFALFFFSTMCDSCATQIPVMNEIARDSGVKIIGVMDDTLGFDKDIGVLATKGVEFATTSTPKSVAFFQKIIGGVSATPITTLFDRNGKKIKQWVGAFSQEEFNEVLRRI